MASSPPPEAPTLSPIDTNEPTQHREPISCISYELQIVLQHIVEDVVTGLGCIGAMVATLEQGNALPVQAYSVSMAPSLLKQLEDELGISFIGPRSVAYLDAKKFRDNLGVRAVKGANGHPEIVVSNKLHDLFRPAVNKSSSDLAQKLTGIKQVAAVPFCLEDEVVGNLFACAGEPFSDRDIKFLTAFGHQAATAIQSQRNLAAAQALERVTLALQASMLNENQALQTVVDAMVQTLGYAGAMVATLEPNNTLPVRAYAVDIASHLLKQLEDRLGVSPIGPQSVAYLDDERFKHNLSVRAIKGSQGEPEIVTSDELYDLFRPVVNKPLSDLAQKILSIKQVLAVPFFLEGKVIGNLFVATRKPKFSEGDKNLLKAFGQQATAGIQNARLYRKAEERRQVAEMFGKMAFSASASVHTLRNHAGFIRGQLGLLKTIDQFSAEDRREILELIPKMFVRLDEMADILVNLHEPWHESPDILTNVNRSLIRAVDKVMPDRDETKGREGIAVSMSLSENLPLIKTSPDMLTEAFQALVKNAVEAIQEKRSGGNLWIESRLKDNSEIQILIRDDGIGIEPGNLSKLFEIRWSTKKAGIGFGLFWTKDYIEGIGGSVEVISVWQKGTTICVNLPVPI